MAETRVRGRRWSRSDPLGYAARESLQLLQKQRDSSRYPRSRGSECAHLLPAQHLAPEVAQSRGGLRQCAEGLVREAVEANPHGPVFPRRGHAPVFQPGVLRLEGNFPGEKVRERLFPLHDCRLLRRDKSRLPSRELGSSRATRSVVLCAIVCGGVLRRHICAESRHDAPPAPGDDPGHGVLPGADETGLLGGAHSHIGPLPPRLVRRPPLGDFSRTGVCVRAAKGCDGSTSLFPTRYETASSPL